MSKRYQPLVFDNVPSKRPRVDHRSPSKSPSGSDKYRAKASVAVKAQTEVRFIADDDDDDFLLEFSEPFQPPTRPTNLINLTTSFSDFQNGAPLGSTQMTTRTSPIPNHVPADLDNFLDDEEGDLLLSQLDVEAHVPAPPKKTEEEKKKPDPIFKAPAAPVRTQASFSQSINSSQEDHRTQQEQRRKRAQELRLQFLQKQIAKLTDEVTKFKSNSTEANEKVQAKDNEISTMRYEMSKLHQEIEKLKLEKIRENESSKSAVSEEVKNLKRSCQTLQKQLKEKDQEIEVAKKSRTEERPPQSASLVQLTPVVGSLASRDFEVDSGIWRSFNSAEVSTEMRYILRLQTALGTLQDGQTIDEKCFAEIYHTITSILTKVFKTVIKFKKIDLHEYHENKVYLNKYLEELSEVVKVRLQGDQVRPISERVSAVDLKALHVASLVFLSTEFCRHLKLQPELSRRMLNRLSSILSEIITMKNIAHQNEVVTTVSYFLANLGRKSDSFSEVVSEVSQLFHLTTLSCLFDIPCIISISKFLRNYVTGAKSVDFLCNSNSQVTYHATRTQLPSNCCPLIVFGMRSKAALQRVWRYRRKFVSSIVEIAGNMIDFLLQASLLNPAWLVPGRCKCVGELGATFLISLFMSLEMFEGDRELLDLKAMQEIGQSATFLLSFLFLETSGNEAWRFDGRYKDYFSASIIKIKKWQEVLGLKEEHLFVLSEIDVKLVTQDVAAMTEAENGSSMREGSRQRQGRINQLTSEWKI